VPVFDDNGQIVADNVLLDTTVKVIAPRVPPEIGSLKMQGQIERDYAGSRLLGWSLEAPVVQKPNFVRLALLWQGTAPAAARSVQAALIDRAGNPAQVVESTVPALQPDEIRRDQIGFWLPPEFQPGTYTVQVKVMNEQQQVIDTLELATVEVKP
jgi:hypothetical protein